MMYLSRLVLNSRSRQVQRELADPYEMHRTICRAFPNANYAPNESSGILFRQDLHPGTGIPTLLVQSLQLPDWSFLLADRKDYLLGEASLPPGVKNPAWKEITLQPMPGQRFFFRLRANPTFKKTVEKSVAEKHKMRLGIFKEEDQHQWLKRKLESAGAGLISVRSSNSHLTRGKLFIEREDKKRMRFAAVQFDGLLEVLEPDKLFNALQHGIGSGKGLGFGLLSLAPTRG